MNNMEEVEIIEGQIDKSCRNCGINRRINVLGMCGEAARLVQNKCLMCRFSKNASYIEATHKKLGIDRPLEDNWQSFEEK